MVLLMSFSFMFFWGGKAQNQEFIQQIQGQLKIRKIRSCLTDCCSPSTLDNTSGNLSTIHTCNLKVYMLKVYMLSLTIRPVMVINFLL